MPEESTGLEEETGGIGAWQSTHWLGKWRCETEWEVGLVDVDVRFNEQTIQMSKLVLTGETNGWKSVSKAVVIGERERARASEHALAF